MISSSPRADGKTARTASRMRGPNRYTPTRAKVGRRIGGLLDQPDNATFAVELRHAEARRVGHLGKEDRRRDLRLAGGESIDQRADVALEKVVDEVHHEVVVAHEVPGDEHRMRKAERRLLSEVGGPHPEGVSVSDGGRRRVPAPPASTSAFTSSASSGEVHLHTPRVVEVALGDDRIGHARVDADLRIVPCHADLVVRS